MLEDLKKHITNNLPYLQGKQILLAISGGIDSVVLAYMLNELGLDIALAHCNFHLRGEESNLDQVFIEELAGGLKIKSFSISFDTKAYAKEKNMSIQIAARELRYNYFKELIKEHNFDYVLTAHHADDNLETFLINLTRGTGLEGLTGIPERNGNIIRPLLPFSRHAIIKYAEENDIKWREDKSNSEKKYVRNKIRHQVIPVLKEINPSLLASFGKTSANLQESKAIVKDRVEGLEKDIVSKESGAFKFNIKKIVALPNPKAYLYQFLKQYNFNEWDKVYGLLSAQTGKYLRTNSHILLKNREFLVLSSLVNSKDNLEDEYYICNKSVDNIEFPLKVNVESTKDSKKDGNNVILIDEALLVYPLIIRKKKEGDYFYPTGMFGKKKVSKYFKDEKLSFFEKNNTWLLCNNDNNIIWIIGLRQDRRFKISCTTTSTLKISI